MTGTTFSVAEIAAALGAEAFGDTSLKISGAAEPQSAEPHQLADHLLG